MKECVNITYFHLEASFSNENVRNTLCIDVDCCLYVRLYACIKNFKLKKK